MNQREIDFTDAARLEAHLVRCGLSDVQARLCGLVLRGGEAGQVGERVVRRLRISSRNAARELRCTSPAVVKAARRVEKMGLMRVVPGGGGRPPTYVLDVLAARSLATLEDELAEQLAAGDWSAGDQVQTGANRCKPVQTTALVPVEESLRDSCIPVPAGGGSQRFAAVSGGSQRFAARAAGPGGAARAGLERRPLPWSTRDGFTNDELSAAVGARDVAWLEHLFDEAASMGWIRAPRVRDGAGDAWLRFLTLASCAARRPYHSRRAAMIAAVKRDVDVSRTSQADEAWAEGVLREAHRDPALAGRMVAR